MLKEKGKIDRHRELPIHEDFIKKTLTIIEIRNITSEEWQDKWLRERSGGIRIENVYTPVLGMDFPIKTWDILNRIHTRQRKLYELM